MNDSRDRPTKQELHELCRIAPSVGFVLTTRITATAIRIDLATRRATVCGDVIPVYSATSTGNVGLTCIDNTTMSKALYIATSYHGSIALAKQWLTQYNNQVTWVNMHVDSTSGAFLKLTCSIDMQKRWRDKDVHVSVVLDSAKSLHTIAHQSAYDVTIPSILKKTESNSLADLQVPTLCMDALDKIVPTSPRTFIAGDLAMFPLKICEYMIYGTGPRPLCVKVSESDFYDNLSAPFRQMLHDNDDFLYVCSEDVHTIFPPMLPSAHS